MGLRQNRVMRNKRILIGALPHVLLWGGLGLIFYFQNDEIKREDLWDGLIILGSVILITYVNLYFLINRFFLKKKYVSYTLALLICLALGATIITQLVPGLQQIGNIPVFAQQMINLFMFVLLTSGLQLGVRYFNNQIKLREVENKQLKMELSLLKSQVHPHFLFNTLNNLYGLITQQENERAAEVTERLSALMRYLLESSKADRVSLKKEIKFLQDYIELEKIRITDRATVDFSVSPLQADCTVPPLLFIPLVENAFKHGQGPHIAKPEIRLLLSVQGKDVFFESINSVSPETRTQSTDSGMGLSNLRKRLDILFSKDYILETEETDTQYKIRLNFPV
ncbi:MAG TPA: hypothetical protein DCE41_12920 [Cytophagales bacterium]|nr:hypothetical protein [Cytophagales bacterium]